jgi:hypothetical protein
MLSEGSLTPNVFQTLTSFGGSILSMKNLSNENSMVESFTSSSEFSDSKMTKVSVYTLFQAEDQPTKNRMDPVEPIEKKSCKCLII